jgi:predicted nucleic acid-binding protein
MSAKFFIDTNIFVYSFDERQPAKLARSRALIQDGLSSGAGIISTQVIHEFLNVATQKFAVPVKPNDIRLYTRMVLNPLCQVYPDLALFETCLDLQAETHYSFFESLIITAAIQGGCDILYLEDLQPGQQVHGVRIVNPFMDYEADYDKLL